MASALRSSTSSCFNTQPPEGGWFITKISSVSFGWFQHTAARRRLGQQVHRKGSCHGFNTQSPEGGWKCSRIRNETFECFNTQPPEGGWDLFANLLSQVLTVSTHSRPKAAGKVLRTAITVTESFNTQPPEGGW